MSDHLPECPMLDAIPLVDEGWDEGPCICDRLRSCEQRVREEERFRCLTMSENRSRWREEGVNAGYAAGLDAARKAVAGLPVIKEWWEAKGDYVHGIEDALAAIDTLKGEQA